MGVDLSAWPPEPPKPARASAPASGASAARPMVAPASSAEPTPNARWAALLVVAAILLMLQLTVGLRGEHYLAVAVAATLILIGGRAYRFLLLFSPLPLSGIVYDLSRKLALANPNVHVADLYHAELRWFGIGSGDGRLTLPEYFTTHTTAAFDLLCGLAYLVYLYVPMLMALLLFFVSRRHMVYLGWSFFLVNLLGIAIYLLYPAAPPWYVAEYGLGPVKLDAPPSPAGALRFDELLGIDYFQQFYSRSSHVFGAMPSLHVGYTAVAFFGVIGLGRRWELLAGGFALLVAFAAVYLQHHYVLDVLVGAICALLAYAIVRFVADRRGMQARKAS